MGTNFYLQDKRLPNEEGQHIGKRSAAGKYCFDCKKTLCQGGEENVHSSRFEWFEVCPQCQTKSGVRGCCSFTWAMQPGDFNRALHGGGFLVVVDEYGREYDDDEAKQIPEECPIHYKDWIGREFS